MSDETQGYRWEQAWGKLQEALQDTELQKLDGTLPDSKVECDSLLEGNATLQKLILTDPDVRRIYLEYAIDTSVIRTFSNSNYSNDGEAESGVTKNAASYAGSHEKPGHFFSRKTKTSRAWLKLNNTRAWLGVAASVLLLVSVAWLVGLQGDRPVRRAFVQGATTDCVFRGGAGEQGERLYVGDSFDYGIELFLENGTVELDSGSSVSLVVSAPAKFKLEDGDLLTLESGAVVADVSSANTGITFATKWMDVTDYGTVFGVAVQPGREIQIGVFDGSVLVEGKGDCISHPELPVELSAGDGLKAVSDDSSTGQVLVTRTAADSFSFTRKIESVIGSVKSNTPFYYEVINGGFRNDSKAYTDREHEWNGLVGKKGFPKFLLGGDYVRTTNSDKLNENLELTLELLRPCRLYILIEENIIAPEWLSTDFRKTKYIMGLDLSQSKWSQKAELGIGAGNSIDQIANVWVKKVPKPTTITLGPKARVGWPSEKGMYGIVAVPLD